jgi:spermidine/putrescine transport system ATP-binding protein
MKALPDGTSDGYAVVRLADYSLCRLPSEHVAGAAELEIGVRPEKIRLLADGESAPDGQNVLRGNVRDASYTGVSTQYVIELQSGGMVTVYEQNSSRTGVDTLHRPGDEVAMTWAPHDTFVVSAGGKANLET